MFPFDPPENIRKPKVIQKLSTETDIFIKFAKTEIFGIFA